MAFFPDGTSANYLALANALGDVPAPGRLMFAAGPRDGGWQVVQVWQSREQLDAFNQAHFFPAVTKAGPLGFPKPPVVTDFVASYITHE